MTPHYNNLSPSYEDIHNACRGLVGAANEAGMTFDLVVGISRGGLIPGVMISHMMDVPFIPIQYSSKAGAGDDKNHDNILPDLPTDKFILIVDDICDTGHTLKEIVQHYADKGCKVYTYVLFYKARPRFEYLPDFKWRTIPQDSGWVIFPFERNEQL